MKTPISRKDAPHYVWGQACDGWRLADQAGLRVTEERVPPGAFETRHYHKNARQFFYVLEGEAVLEIDGTAHRLSKGVGIEVEPGSPHQFMNKSAADVIFLLISDSRDKADRIEMALKEI